VPVSVHEWFEAISEKAAIYFTRIEWSPGPGGLGEAKLRGGEREKSRLELNGLL
jgi:hypothetical protein